MAKVARPPTEYDGRAHVDSHGEHKPVRIILHSTESGDAAGLTDLRGLAMFWKGQAKGYGSQIAVDLEGLTGRYVADTQIAWHTSQRNTGSLGIEQFGKASFTRRLWILRPRQLAKVAWWIAFWSKKFSIPIKKDVEFGVSTHAMQSKAFGGDHTDPGLGYPLQLVLITARVYKRFGKTS